MPDDAAIEKAQMLAALGAEVVRVRPVSITHPDHPVNMARRRAQQEPGSVFADQFENEANRWAPGAAGPGAAGPGAAGAWRCRGLALPGLALAGLGLPGPGAARPGAGGPGAAGAWRCQAWRCWAWRCWAWRCRGLGLLGPGAASRRCSRAPMPPPPPARARAPCHQPRRPPPRRRAHLRTGEEIWRQTGGRLHAFVSGAGTGGTIAGVSQYLKGQDPGVQVRRPPCGPWACAGCRVESAKASAPLLHQP
jgi:hypothetical protein